MKYKLGQEVYYVIHNGEYSPSKIKQVLDLRPNFIPSDSSYLDTWEDHLDIGMRIKKGIIDDVSISPRKYEFNAEKINCYFIINKNGYDKIEEGSVFLDILLAQDYINKIQEADIATILHIKQEVDRRVKVREEILEKTPKVIITPAIKIKKSLFKRIFVWR